MDPCILLRPIRNNSVDVLRDHNHGRECFSHYPSYIRSSYSALQLGAYDGAMARKIPADARKRMRFVSHEMACGRSMLVENGVKVVTANVWHVERARATIMCHARSAWSAAIARIPGFCGDSDLPLRLIQATMGFWRWARYRCSLCVDGIQFTHPLGAISVAALALTEESMAKAKNSN
jgi:hypothetical protein